MISPNNQPPTDSEQLQARRWTMWVIGGVTLMESKEAMDVRILSVPVMKDQTQKTLDSPVLNLLARSLTVLLPSPMKNWN